MNRDGDKHSHEDCCCGHGHCHNHDHEHQHEQHPTHHNDCGCGCDHTHHAIEPLAHLTNVQADFLLALTTRQYLPVACFALAKQDQPEAYAIALEPVYLVSAQDTMEDVKALAGELAQLEEHGLISLDYDARLTNYTYAEYEQSDLYAYFVKTVAEGAARGGALFDTPLLELGSMALTDAGRAAVQEMMQPR